MQKYECFERTWWIKDKSWPGGLRPEAGRKKHLRFFNTEQEARDFCQQWNADYEATHRSNRYSRKAEYTQI